MRTEPVMLDGQRLRPRGHSGRICSRENATCTIILEDSADSRQARRTAQLEVFVEFEQKGTKLDQLPHGTGKGNMLRFHSGKSDLSLNVALPQDWCIPQ